MNGTETERLHDVNMALLTLLRPHFHHLGVNATPPPLRHPAFFCGSTLCCGGVWQLREGADEMRLLGSRKGRESWGVTGSSFGFGGGVWGVWRFGGFEGGVYVGVGERCWLAEYGGENQLFNKLL